MKQEIFEREWAPAGVPRATVAVIHGLGEHSGRYEKLAERFTQAGYAVRAIDLRGHGESPGARGATRFAPALEDIDGLVERCGTRSSSTATRSGRCWRSCGCSSARTRRWRVRSCRRSGSTAP